MSRGPIAGIALLVFLPPCRALAWTFAVSGDSRNCGDVVMPAIAKEVLARRAEFYWHLGDLRKLSGIDEDIRPRPSSLESYWSAAWPDFVAHQIAPFGSLPFFLGIGNHETVLPKTREKFAAEFSRWLDAPELRRQRLRDDPLDARARTYYHWTRRGVDFIYLDNATPDEFDEGQLKWLERTLARDEADPGIKTVVVGMHEALPQSLSSSHSMDESLRGEETGLRVYQDLLKTRDKARKRVYVLASHSHYYMDGTFNTEFWRRHGGVLPGWIVGTAGAVRYSLPQDSAAARAARTNVYGYLLGQVDASGDLRFEFRPVAESDVPPETAARYEPGFVHWCFAGNSEAK